MNAGGFACGISGLALLAVGGCALALFAVLGFDAGVGGTVSDLGRAVGPYLGIIALTTIVLEAAAIASVGIGAARWRLRIGARYIVAAVFASLAFVSTVGLVLLYVVVATSYV